MEEQHKQRIIQEFVPGRDYSPSAQSTSLSRTAHRRSAQTEHHRISPPGIA